MKEYMLVHSPFCSPSGWRDKKALNSREVRLIELSLIAFCRPISEALSLGEVDLIDLLAQNKKINQSDCQLLPPCLNTTDVFLSLQITSTNTYFLLRNCFELVKQVYRNHFKGFYFSLSTVSLVSILWLCWAPVKWGIRLFKFDSINERMDDCSLIVSFPLTSWFFIVIFEEESGMRKWVLI